MDAIFACLPTQPLPFSAADASLPASLFASAAAPLDGGGVDHISGLADALLSDIVSRLPARDAARTAALSPRWRRVWASTPLVLDDARLLPDDCGVRAGPFRCVRLTYVCNYAAARRRGELARGWLRVLAEKGVHDLVLVCRNWPIRADLPAEVLHLASLRRLYLGLWDGFPSKALRRCAVAFPHLLELGLCRTDIKAADIDRLLQCSPVLEKLALIASDNSPRNIRVRSRSLRCVVFWMSVAHELNVLVAPRLERLILRTEGLRAPLGDDFRTRLNIGYVQELKVLGYLDPRIHVLEISNTVIEAGTKPSPRTIVPSVKILAVKVRFGVRREAKMLPSFLRCFPNVETLHVMSDEPSGKFNFKFWQEAGPIRSLQSQIKRVVFKNFRGCYSELAFLRFVWARAQLLQKMVIVLADEDDPASLVAKLKPLACAKRFRKDHKSVILVRNGGCAWSFRVASDLSVSDPFDC
ncbi:hypothetical protein ACP4OV_011500 [Aristida adscensionis]